MSAEVHVLHDADYGWIVEEDNAGEMEIRTPDSDWDRIVSDTGMGWRFKKYAVQHGRNVAAERGARLRVHPLP